MSSESLDPDSQEAPESPTACTYGESLPGRQSEIDDIKPDPENVSGPPSRYSYGDGHDDGLDEKSLSRNDRILHCFRCHREDRHYHGLRSRWYYSIVLGFSFGLFYIVGPFRCRCCGGWRLMCHDLLSPRFWWQSLQGGPVSYTRRKKP